MFPSLENLHYQKMWIATVIRSSGFLMGWRIITPIEAVSCLFPAHGLLHRVQTDHVAFRVDDQCDITILPNRHFFLL